MKRLAIMVLLVWPPAYCCESRHPLKRENARINLLAEIDQVKKELDAAKAEVTAEDGQTKRTDVKKVLGDQADSVVYNLSATEGMDMVLTCVTVDGVTQNMHCDEPGCTEMAQNVWFSIDTGIMIKRCDKHSAK